MFDSSNQRRGKGSRFTADFTAPNPRTRSSKLTAVRTGRRSQRYSVAADFAFYNSVPLGDRTVALEQALQALRDVRHMLPPQGIAIVDDVLECSILINSKRRTVIFESASDDGRCDG